MYHVYILRSLSTGRLYVGTTNDLEKRVRQHNQRSNKSTSAYIPYELVHSEAYPTLSEARKREWYLKCTPGGGREKKRLASAS